MARAVSRDLAFPLVGERARIEAPGADGASVLVRIADGIPAGRLELAEVDGALFVRSLVIAPEYRGYGLGSDAARLVREAAAAAGWPVLRAWAAPDLGLSVYFWSRMGLRPLFGDGPDGGIWFERVLSSSS